MKRFGVFMLVGCVVLCAFWWISGPSKTGSMLEHVKLCNYTALDVPKEECVVTEEELALAIRLSLSVLDLDASELTDEIAVEYLNAEHAAAAKAEIKKDIIENRYYEAVWDRICKSSQILNFPASGEQYVHKLISEHQKCADANGVSTDEYFQTVFKMTQAEYRQEVLSWYAELMLLKAIAEKEKYIITPEERFEAIAYTASFDGITETEAIEAYGEEYFDYLLYEGFLKRWVAETFCNEILAIANM